jgi:hypothetical protein
MVVNGVTETPGRSMLDMVPEILLETPGRWWTFVLP